MVSSSSPGSEPLQPPSDSAPLYVETSAILRSVLEAGTSEEIESRLKNAEVLVTSRLSLVESARAMLRARLWNRFDESRLVEMEAQLSAFWRQCDIWELTPQVGELAESVAPTSHLRSLDALHLATFLLARREIPQLVLLTADERLRSAASP